MQVTGWMQFGDGKKVASVKNQNVKIARFSLGLKSMRQKPLSIFIVEDNVLYAATLSHFLSLNPDYSVRHFNDAKSFLRALDEKPDIVTLDYSLPDASGEQLLHEIKAFDSNIKVIIISGQDEIKVATGLLKKGADDYIEKDNETQDRLWFSIKNLRENISLKNEVESLKQEIEKKYNFHKAIIGNSAAIKEVFSLMEKAVSTNITVSLTGETGTGKEVVAKAIHFNSARKKHPFIAVNVAAIPSELLESEMFGHEKGSFTGAINRRLGKFEEADKGTLFLDEIGEMEINMQAKLLRVLQEQELTRIGGNENIKINVRIIMATNRNLLEEIKKGKFREDLYYRLMGLPIHLPPLRERGNDVLLIAKSFIDRFCEENKLPKKHLSQQAKDKLLSYSFPGNIRELKSLVELGCVMSEADEIHLHHLKVNGHLHIDHFNEHLSLKEINQRLINQYLHRYNNDVLKVASILKIGKSTIYRMLKNNELQIKVKDD